MKYIKGSTFTNRLMGGRITHASECSNTQEYNILETTVSANI
jgi:hypothetical protein